MKPIRFKRSSLVVVVVIAIAFCGCTTKIIGDAARTSTASFLNSVFSSAVNAAIQPQ